MASNQPSTPSAQPRQSIVHRHLDPIDALSEVLFGLIMVMTFTLGAGLIVKEGRDATTQLLFAVVGCNVAWGLIDGVLYVLTSLLGRSEKARLFGSVQKANDDDDALAIIGRELDPRLESLASPEERRRLYRAVLTKLRRLVPEPTRLKREDIRGAIAISGWIFSARFRRWRRS